MTDDRVLNETWSICPVCMKRLPAEIIQRGREVYLRKTCSDHGSFEVIIWRGYSDYQEWVEGMSNPDEGNPKCPDDCGLCTGHLQQTCCVILNVTDRCNLDCAYCCADVSIHKNDPDIDKIKSSLQKIVIKDKTLVQLSGGEPTLRDDLPDIVKYAKEIGAKYVQLNSNGIRLSSDKLYVKELADAGLSFVFMQFDGTEDSIHQRIRNRSLSWVKQKAIDNCAEFNIGVTLVPTLVKGVNTQNIGEIIRFAISQAPRVRGVHFQPVTYLGRFPGLPSDSDRFTLDELIHEIQKQADGLVSEENLLPSCCDHALCGFHGDFIVVKEGLVPLLTRTKKTKQSCCDPVLAEKNREFVARRWQRPELDQENLVETGNDLHDMELFMRRVKSHGFTLTAMAFQDAGNIDLTRLRRCSLHVYDDDRVIPFCSYFLTSWVCK